MEKSYPNKLHGSPLIINSYETTPERPFSLSEPVSLSHSPSSNSDDSPASSFKSNKAVLNMRKTKRHEKKGSSFAYRVKDHVKLGPKLSETLKGKLSLGAKIIQEGGRGNIFKQIFGIKEGEKLLKASQCYLSTTAGPIAGIIFISTEKVAFCSERSLNFSSHDGHLVKAPYKVLIPTRKIKCANRSENVNNPAQKYIEIVTKDDYGFWFMGFLRYEKAFKNLEKAISIANEM